MTKKRPAPRYESHWGPVFADLLRQISGDLREIADDVNGESSDELREIATEIEECADNYDSGTESP